MGNVALSVNHPGSPAPEGWDWVPLASIARMESGHTPSRNHPEYWGGDIPWIGIRDAKRHHGGAITHTTECTNDLGIRNSSARVLPAGTVCLSRTASVGYVVKMGREMATSQDFVNWVCSDRIDPDFLCHLFQAEESALARFSSGSVHQTIYYPELKALHVCIPCIAEQKRIVAALDQAFAALDRTRANAEANLADAEAVFERTLLATFDGLLTHASMSTLADMARDFSRGKSKHRPRNDPKLYGGTYPFIQTGDIRRAEGAIRECSQTYNDVGLAQSKLWPVGTVCITIAANIAETAVLEIDACFPDSVIGMVPDPARATPHYVEYMLRYFSKELKLKGKGSAQDNINLATFEDSKFPFPSLAEQEAIVDRLDDLSRSVSVLRNRYSRQMEDIDELRQSLLQAAFSGQLS